VGVEREASQALDADLRGTPEERRQIRKALFASAVGTSIEWYDFFLYGTAAALVFPKLFFPASSPYAGVLLAFGTYAVGFAARPVGAAIFGHYGDRIGRKATLIITLLLMGLSSAVIGVLPSHASIGVWGAIILTILRIMQGLGVGGEWGGSVLLAMEWGHKRKRGFIASWPQFGVPVGLLLANGAMLGFSAWSGDAFLSWGWRVPFLLSLVLVAVGLWVRLSILETPLFARVLKEQRVERRPVVEVIKRHPKEVVLSALVRTSEQAPFYLFTAFVLEYATSDLGFGQNFILYLVMGAAALALFNVPFFGYLSDRIGRRRMYMIGAATMLVWAFPYFALLETKVAALVGLAIVVSLIPHDMQYGPQAALIAESFTTRLRYSGAGIGYQLASVTAGGPAPLIAAWLLHSFGAYAIAWYIVGTAVVTLIATAFLPERSQVDISVDYDAEAPPGAVAA
jgi:metabolite-proton symporter